MAAIIDIAELDLSQRYTYADYLTWKFPGYVELLHGRVVPKPTPFTNHQQCLSHLIGTVGQFYKKKRGQLGLYAGPFDVRLPGKTGNKTTVVATGDAQIKTVVQPDISVICDLRKIDKRGCLGAPDWIIEIVSPSSLVLDTRTKFDLYAENGVREYWIAYPGEQIITAFALTAAGQYELTGTYAEPGPMPSSSLPELAIEWADVFGEAR